MYKRASLAGVPFGKLGENLKKMRENCGITQGMAAKNLGISRRFLIEIETGAFDGDSISLRNASMIYTYALYLCENMVENGANCSVSPVIEHYLKVFSDR